MTLITLTMTLQVVNISIDPADSNHFREDLSINDIESCVELVLEVFLDKSDAVKEVDEQDESTTTPSSVTITLFNCSEEGLAITENHFSIIDGLSGSYKLSDFNSLSLPIQSPPPKKA